MYGIILLILLVTILVYFTIRPFTYWSRKGVLQRSLYKELRDTVRSVFQTVPIATIVQECYNDFPNERCFGIYSFFFPILLLRDPELIKQIAVKDFDHFSDHSMFISEETEPLWGKNLFALKGDRWRDMRATLSPSFTSSKMKAMFVLINDCAQQFAFYFKDNISHEAIDMKDALTRFANDVIASTAFGITCDSLKDRTNEFYMMGKEATRFKGFWDNIKLLALFLVPKLCAIFGIRMFSKRTSAFFRNLVKANIESREKNHIIRPDMIHLLMEAKKGGLKHESQKEALDSGFAVIEESTIGKDEKRQKRLLTDDDLTAQALIFFFAGFDSVSTMMSFLLYELAVNPEVQEKLRIEVQDTLQSCNNTLTYEGLLKMKYMDMIVSETLRKWPVQPAVDRVCVKSYTIQSTNDEEPPIHLKEGENIWLPIYALHRDPNFYPNPDRFDPERFSDENNSLIYPYTFFPFGTGPRSCIGNRFALLEAKAMLSHMLSNFEIISSEKTVIPIKLARDVFTLDSADGFWFKLKRLRI